MKKRILTMTPFLWSGAGKLIVRLMREFAAKGIECELISSRSSKGMRDWPGYISELNEAGVRCHRIDLFDRASECVWKSVLELCGILQEKHYDLIHVHAGVPAFVATAARDRLQQKLPVIATFHSWNPERPSWMNNADIWSLNRCDYVVTASQSYLELLLQWGLLPCKAKSIHPGVDLPELKYLSRQSRKPRAFRILCVGRIEPRKDQKTILQAFSYFNKQVPDSELWLVGPPGDEAYYAKLLEDTKRFGWQHRAFFKGRVKDIGRCYRDADLFVSASHDEGLGLSLLEAMAHEIPTVSTPVRGHMDFAKEGINTMQFPTGDPHALESAMLRLYRDPVLRRNLGKKGRGTVKQMFLWRHAVGSYVDVFKSLW